MIRLFSLFMMMNCFCGIPNQRKAFSLFPARPISEILTIANLRHAVNKTWIYTEPEFSLFWMKLCSSDNHYTTVPHNVTMSSFELNNNLPNISEWVFLWKVGFNPDSNIPAHEVISKKLKAIPHPSITFINNPLGHFSKHFSFGIAFRI